MCWHENFVAAWDDLRESYDERFYRMWTYYLLICAGGFGRGATSSGNWSFLPMACATAIRRKISASAIALKCSS